MSGVLAGWAVLTVLRQFRDPRLAQLLARTGPLSFCVPVSTFFAPTPGSTDHHLLVRDRLRDGSMTQWREACFMSPRSVQHMIWHPGRRVEKAFFDASQELRILQYRKMPLRRLKRSLPYRTLLHAAIHQCDHHPDATQTQFLLVELAGADTAFDPRGLITSDVHDLPASAPRTASGAAVVGGGG